VTVRTESEKWCVWPECGDACTVHCCALTAAGRRHDWLVSPPVICASCLAGTHTSPAYPHPRSSQSPDPLIHVRRHPRAQPFEPSIAHPAHPGLLAPRTMAGMAGKATATRRASIFAHPSPPIADASRACPPPKPEYCEHAPLSSTPRQPLPQPPHRGVDTESNGRLMRRLGGAAYGATP